MSEQKNQEKNDILKRQLINSLILIIGFSMSLFLVTISNTMHKRSDRDVRDIGTNKKFPLISPLLFCKYGDGIENTQYTYFRFKVEDYINKLMSQNKTNHVSVYFRDLNNGPWFGINENESFNPSSLLKLPLLISTLKEAEENDNNLLEKKITYKKSDSASVQYFKPEKNIELGETYTVTELLERSIIYSDNESSILLYKELGDSSLIRTYSDLGLISPDGKKDFIMNVKEYSSFFRVLFNSSYISKNNSESALELLTITKFNKGLRAGVSDNITVAHKFGEQISSNGDLQLHDCGIIYAPKKPYILCVMTRGKDFNELSNIIKNISEIVFTGITEQD